MNATQPPLVEHAAVTRFAKTKLGEGGTVRRELDPVAQHRAVFGVAVREQRQTTMRHFLNRNHAASAASCLTLTPQTAKARHVTGRNDGFRRHSPHTTR